MFIRSVASAAGASDISGARNCCFIPSAGESERHRVEGESCDVKKMAGAAGLEPDWQNLHNELEC
jgi:hypothetical protein